VSAWAERRRLRDAEWLMDREQAQTVRCRDCKAEPGSTCVNLTDRLPLVKQPAHRSRIADTAGRTPAGRPTAPEAAPRLLPPPVLHTAPREHP
jgi:hypothetical protein